MRPWRDFKTYNSLADPLYWKRLIVIFGSAIPAGIVSIIILHSFGMFHGEQTIYHNVTYWTMSLVMSILIWKGAYALFPKPKLTDKAKLRIAHELRKQDD